MVRTNQFAGKRPEWPVSRKEIVMKLASSLFVLVLGLIATIAGPARATQDRGATDPERVVFRWVGTTSHAWGAWVTAGAAVEDWVEEAIALCAEEDFCEVNVFEGPEHATHEIPVPEANREGLKWVLRYRHRETPRVVVEEMQTEPGRELRTWTFDR